jgi:DNA-binding CsgD family transcriptional regulator
VLAAEGAAEGAQPGEASVAVVVVDDECRCLDASDETCHLLGMARDEIIGAGLEELLAEEARESFGHVWHAFREGEGHAGPFRTGGAAPLDIDIDVSAEVLPSRHVVLLARATAKRRLEGFSDGGVAPIRPASARRGRPAPTARERQILGMVAGGATDGEIAGHLALSRATVRTHVRNAKAKLGASTRAQAVALALEHRMIEPA